MNTGLKLIMEGREKLVEYNTSYIKVAEERIQELASYVQVYDEMPKVKILDNALVFPRKNGGVCHNTNIPYQGLGGVIDSDGNFVKESIIYDLKIQRNIDRIAFGGTYNVSLVEEDDRVAIYLGLAHKHWGHFLVDIIQRCWYPMVYDLLGNSNEKKKCRDGIKLPENYIFVFSGFGDNSNKFNGNYAEFFRLLGLDDNKIVFVNLPTKFKRVIVPGIAIYPGEFICSVYRILIDTVIEQAMIEQKKLQREEKIYFSRTHLTGTMEIGEKEIENAMMLSGYKVMYPEELSLGEQIFYWQTAKSIACINGTIPHNCIFAHKNIVLIVFNKMNRIVGYQFTMDIVQGITPIYITAYYEPFKRYPLSVSRGPFWILITDDVKRFIKENYNEDVLLSKKTFKNWISYLKLCLIAEVRFRFRGTKAKLKKVIKKC